MTEDRKTRLTQLERHYEPMRLNRFFAWSALALLAAVLWSVIDDFTREWKQYQRQFNALEVTRLEGEIGKTQQGIEAQRSVPEAHGHVSAPGGNRCRFCRRGQVYQPLVGQRRDVPSPHGFVSAGTKDLRPDACLPRGMDGNTTHAGAMALQDLNGNGVDPSLTLPSPDSGHLHWFRWTGRGLYPLAILTLGA